MDAAGEARAVGRIGPNDPWVGFAPSIGGGYDVLVGGPDGMRRAPASVDVLLALATAYFEEALPDPPEELTATHGDVGELVRHLAESEADPRRRVALEEAVDAVDDGLAPDVVIGRLGRAMTGAWASDPLACLIAEAEALSRDD